MQQGKSDLTPVWAEFVAASAVQDRLSRDGGEGLLGVVFFGGAPSYLVPADCPALVVPMPQCGEEDKVEAWFSRAPVSRGSEGDLRYSRNEDVLFGAIRLTDDPHASVETAAREAYRKILAFAADQGYGHLLRVWNYLPGINRETFGLERYRQFCRGRHDALEEHGCRFGHDLPAASAVGTAGDGLIIYFLAVRSLGAQVENHRQTSAYLYPRRYGPRSPSFSRAMLQDWGAAKQVYISGTASIIGHETVHAGDPERQILETLRNMDAVMDKATEGRFGLKEAGPDSVVKVYLRNPGNYRMARNILEGAVGQASLLFLQGDICRSDLSVEIEAIIGIDGADEQV